MVTVAGEGEMAAETRGGARAGRDGGRDGGAGTEALTLCLGGRGLPAASGCLWVPCGASLFQDSDWVCRGGRGGGGGCGGGTVGSTRVRGGLAWWLVKRGSASSSSKELPCGKIEGHRPFSL